jgi:hypothetical protein
MAEMNGKGSRPEAGATTQSQPREFPIDTPNCDEEKFLCRKERINHISAAGTKSTVFAPV